MKVATIMKGLSETRQQLVVIESREEGGELMEALEFAAKAQPRKRKLKRLVAQLSLEILVA